MLPKRLPTAKSLRSFLTEAGLLVGFVLLATLFSACGPEAECERVIQETAADQGTTVRSVQCKKKDHGPAECTVEVVERSVVRREVWVCE